eukprot:CAMPEP_0114259502 /NCGR_PEP_ID=MMETSP0058-20121206/19927_1 /TAXON_ID=36894 /ORGANISM="Pyramimonas parkeae, CCMP726" /LENGTH=272 /DNA_ID=CAMNT_0001374553 /DNA_START=44 /DNA_END=862 /DNA_ORIENTATION=+
MEGAIDLAELAAVRALDGPIASHARFTHPADPTLWEADPFYEAAEAVQEELDELNATVDRWRALGSASGEGDPTPPGEEDHHALKSQALSQCDSIQEQAAEFQKVMGMCKQQPQKFHLSRDEVERRQEFVASVLKEVMLLREEVCAHLPRRQSTATTAEAAPSPQLESTSQDKPNKSASRPAGVLIGDLGKPPTWEVLRLEEERKQREQEDLESGTSYLMREPKARTLPEEIRRQLKKWYADSDSRMFASVGLFVIGVFGLHTFYGHDESLV